ncbi:MAG TPA: S9 family peptidase [Acidobacteriaceae bacterium]|jgi:dipeptidyl aminopeptidase/acylaminoacyl peptidase|nr:S9 family peptidase [Acidobacteriaceae bacterium]
MRRFWILMVSLAGVAPGMAAAQTVAPAKHPFGVMDWATLRSVGAAAVAPDGSILYVVTHGGAQGPTQREWWTIEPDGTHAAKLDLPEGFSPMGYTRDGHSLYGSWEINHLGQFAIFPLKDGKAAAVPTTVVLLPRGVDAALPTPQGDQFALVADPRAPDALDDIRHVQEPDESSIYVVKADGTGGAWWCSGLHSVSAGILGGGSGALAWSADGRSLAALSDLPRIGHHNVATDIDVCSASGAQHIASIPNTVTGVAWTAGGRKIAFLSTKTAVLTPEHVWTVSAAGGEADDATPTLDGTAMNIGSDVRGDVWVVVDRGVRTEVDTYRDGALKVAYQWPDGVVGGVPVSSPYAGTSEQLALMVGDPSHARNVAVPEGDHLRRITHEGDEQLASVDLGAVRDVRWTSKGGIALEGIATFPAGYVEGQKYKFLVLPHGGPEANDELSLDPFSRMIAGLGYVVLQPEYRGSTGYGADFLAAIYQHFGDRAYEDVDSATDYAIAQGWADPNRLAIFGWSAGGFMTSWTVTQTGRYKAAVEGAGITDWAPFLWTSDIQQIDYDARWTDEDPDAFRKFSAVDFAKNVTTPLLILHGEADHRVPTFQGIEYFQILAARGKTVRMVTYPGSPHFPGKWEQRLNVMQEVSDWLAKYNP